ncbi:uncharacterized protein LOC107274292 isoform X3 [Cephus cinctus]|uniref:Uncharacterized protein LOC107274292 isoform X3 n=1 Tax=Cephus cinctus TaxID=211228 RepID=A0AAJ7RUF1_CEPCN|nr:uncharacterized protein LOC107274292 isoform X3 [Cephus cinctus]
MSIKISASVASRVLQGILHDWEITRLVMSDHLLLDLFATVNVDRNTGACAISTDHFRRICAACANCLYKESIDETCLRTEFPRCGFETHKLFDLTSLRYENL